MEYTNFFSECVKGRRCTVNGGSRMILAKPNNLDKPYKIEGWKITLPHAQNLSFVTVGVEWLQWALRSYLINNKTEEKGKRHTNSSRTKPSFVKTPKSEFSSSAFDCFEKKQRQKERKRKGHITLLTGWWNLKCICHQSE